jgi:hydroxymethylglutaryl-CoA reductase
MASLYVTLLITRVVEERKTDLLLGPCFMKKSSRIKEFYKKTLSERLKTIQDFAALSNKEITNLKNLEGLSFKAADRMAENVISIFSLPLGIATNFVINKKEFLIPMATEEPSVIAAASHAAKLARSTGGFFASTTNPIMIGQIQVVQIPNLKKALQTIKKNENLLLDLANKQDSVLISNGGGAKEIKLRSIETSRGSMLIVHLLVDVRNAMGANIVNTMVEKIAPTIEHLSEGKAKLRIVSNLAIYRIAKAEAVWKKDDIGSDSIEGILDAHALAEVDPFRLATHNKGIMNGIDAVAIATGNDFRAIEAGAHSYSVISGTYKPLTSFKKTINGDISGSIKLPITVGTIGGITQSHPTAKIALKILGAECACELAQIMASVGLAQNFAALRALTSEGLQKGHMRLHSKNLAIMAGAQNGDVNAISQQMIQENNFSIKRAQEILKLKVSHT